MLGGSLRRDSDVIITLLILTGCVSTMRRISVSANTQPIPHPFVLHVYILYTSCISNECYWLSVRDSPPYGRVSCRSTVHFFAPLKFWTVVWENTNSVYFHAVLKNTENVQGIRCLPKGSHLIPCTSAVFSNTALKWTPLAYLLALQGAWLSGCKEWAISRSDGWWCVFNILPCQIVAWLT